MAVEDTEVEDLRVAALASGSLTICRGCLRPSTQTDGLALGESRQLNGTGLIRVFVVRSTAPAGAGAEVMLCALDRNAYDGRVSAGLLDLCCALRGP